MLTFFDKFLTKLKPVSPLMQKIINDVIPVANHGTVPADALTGSVDPQRIEIIEGSENVYRLIAREIKKATKQILIQAFVWKATTQAVKDIKQALCEIDPAHSVDVFILIDHLDFVAKAFFLGELHLQQTKYDAASIGLEGLPDHVRLHIGFYAHNSHGANHNKAIVIDDTLILTGVNYQHENYGPKAFHDGALFIPDVSTAAAIHDFDAMWSDRTNKHESDKTPALRQRRFAENQSTILYVTNKIRLWPAKLPGYQADLPQDPLNNAYLAAINNAERIIRITVPNLNTPEIMQALVSFINDRGGRVELLMSKNLNNLRETFYGGTNQDTLDALYSMIELECREQLQIRWFNRESTGDHVDVIHAKFMAIDEQVVIYGSSNLDLMSLHNSHEANSVIDDKEFTARATHAFFTKWFVTGLDAAPREDICPIM